MQDQWEPSVLLGQDELRSRRRRRVASSRTRRNQRLAGRTATTVSLLFGVAGVGVLVYPAATDAYQGQVQERLTRTLSDTTSRDTYTSRRVSTGDGLTRLRIPALGVDVVVVEGTSAAALRAGAGHFPNTPLPGEAGNVAIAGHRTTYGQPFADLDRLSPGDRVVLDTPVGRYAYAVSETPYVVEKTDWRPIASTSGHVLTLTTCHPKRSDRQRLVVRAQLVSSADGE